MERRGMAWSEFREELSRGRWEREEDRREERLGLERGVGFRRGEERGVGSRRGVGFRRGKERREGLGSGEERRGEGR